MGAGQYQSDSDSGLQLLGHRMFDPSVGRFISSDPAKAGTNWYAYCTNNPIGATDPTGLNPFLLALGAFGAITPVGWVVIAVVVVVMVVAIVAVDYGNHHSLPQAAVTVPSGSVGGPGSPIPGSPRFIAPADGPAVEIPPGYVGRVADNGRGQVWQPVGATGNGNQVRVMDPPVGAPPGAPGYGRIYNPVGQPINIRTGKPDSNANTHPPLTW